MSDPNQPSEEPGKIHIDSDWKEQVRAEKEKLKQPSAPEVPPEEPTSEPPPAAPSGESAEDYGDPPLPPASLMTLVSMLATESLMALGQFRDPATGQPMQQRLNTARHLIDTLDVLQEKTKGNLQPEEAKMLEDTTHQLRMVYVELNKP
ncbi:MAG: DUF1844 domain-containing protein [Pirellulaceae bacterium]